MNKAKIKFSMFLCVILVAFSAGHAFGANCPYSQPSCSYGVQGCIQLTYSCQESGGGACWREFGKCCEESGMDFSIYCGPGCDAGGGGGCGLEM